MLTLIGINPTEVVLAADVANGQAPHRLGSLGAHVDDAGYKVYKWVEYKENAAAIDGVAGEVVCYQALLAATYVVSSDFSATNLNGAGVLQAALSEGDQGWIQVAGPATLTIALTAGVNGDPLTATGAGDGTLDSPTAVTDNVVAVCVNAATPIIMCDFPL